MLQNYYKNTNAVFIAHGYVAELLGKTINGVIMHSTVFNVVALVDRYKEGIDTSTNLPGVRKKIPVFSSLEEALKYTKPKVAILMENSLNKSYDEIKLAITNKLDIINPGFNFLTNNPELKTTAQENNAKLFDLRKADTIDRYPDGKILDVKSKVVLVAGTDCGLGKRTAAYELYMEANKQGIKAAFAATGQTGIMLGCDGGIVFDSISSNFVAGAIEKLIWDIDQEKKPDVIFLEGQASIMHYGGSCVLSILHAGNPHAIVMVHDEKRKMHVEYI
jgi:uncharacterized NAD-dependent epimerase/dehydratase family protein